MIAEAFITFGIGNIFFIIGGVAFLVAGFALWGVSEVRESNNGPLLVFMMLVLAVLLGVLAPHWHTDNLLHGPQARADFRLDYGRDTKIVSMSLQDHWAVARIPGCGQQIRAEMRRVHGRYWFAYGVQKKGNDGQSYTDHRPITLRQLLLMCGQSGEPPTSAVSFS